jgi:hypothetical protein
MLEAVGVGDVSEGGAREDEVAIQNVERLTGYWAQAKVDEFMCGIDEGVVEECSKREARYL